MVDMDEHSVELNLMADEGLVGIKFGAETAAISWMDALEMATRLVNAAYSAAASINVDREVLRAVQKDLFNKVMGE